ncbi:MAG TPA: M20 family metallopeptidase [Pyrinomonadaceae bacterium]|nr:M20 family metallopeptidase [Pyrinomonadaceae bacterium]
MITREAAAGFRNFFSERQDALLSLVRALVETESPSGDLEGSRAVVSLLADAVRSISGEFEVERIPAEGYGEHLRVRAFKRREESVGKLLVVGHTDTVHTRGSITLRPFRADGERLYGPGIFDMKANCVIALEALRACVVLNQLPRREVVLLLTCDEETGSERGRLALEDEARGAACALVLEPPASGGRVKTARKGTGIFTMEAVGRAAHAGLEPEKGASAVLEIARQIERLHSLCDTLKGTTVNVGVVEGGTRSNVVAAHARAEIDVRFSAADEARRMEDAILNSRPFDERVKLIVRGGINRPPLERSEGVARLYEHARAVAAALDFNLGEASVGGASDGNFIAAMNVPVLDGLGIDGDGAHAEHEHIITSDMTRRGALLAALIATL